MIFNMYHPWENKNKHTMKISIYMVCDCFEKPATFLQS